MPRQNSRCTGVHIWGSGLWCLVFDIASQLCGRVHAAARGVGDVRPPRGLPALTKEVAIVVGTGAEDKQGGFRRARVAFGEAFGELLYGEQKLCTDALTPVVLVNGEKNHLDGLGVGR